MPPASPAPSTSGVIGVTLAGEGCDGGDATLPEEDQPQPVIARSGREGRRRRASRSPSRAPIEKFARATTAPFAEAITTIAPSGDPATAYISGGRTISHSGVVGGNTREAIARTEIDGLSLGGGPVQAPRHDVGGDPPLRRDERDRRHLLHRRHRDRRPEDPRVRRPHQAARGPQRRCSSRSGSPSPPPKVRVEQGIVFVDPMTVADRPEPDARRRHRPAHRRRPAAPRRRHRRRCSSRTAATPPTSRWPTSCSAASAAPARSASSSAACRPPPPRSTRSSSRLPPALPPLSLTPSARDAGASAPRRSAAPRRGARRRRRRHVRRGRAVQPSPSVPSPPSPASAAGSWPSSPAAACSHSSPQQRATAARCGHAQRAIPLEA